MNSLLVRYRSHTVVVDILHFSALRRALVVAVMSPDKSCVVPTMLVIAAAVLPTVVQLSARTLT
jgi:hypothetical protein